MTQLIRIDSWDQRIPIAQLVQKNNVYYIQPLTDHTHAPLHIAAPGIARVPKTTSAQRWHQRLGHTDQKILKKTAQCSKGMEGLDTGEITLCETCHLSKAQRYVSREPRPTPFEPLHEVFIDTVGKLTTACNGHQYAVIITDAKSRMRWTISISTKDQIAPQLVKWVEHQYHQFGKRVRTIFKDGGSEFSRIKTYCDQHGIRTDVSAPYTPEQNGTSKASNKVILRKARSMLIDAKMPACYWPWAIEHACFITNRFYCLRTKSVPLLSFLQGLKQPHPNQIDSTNLPRFGCRAYKLIDPKPGKFEPRASMGWFIGFQKNTNKNFLIYYPHWTPVRGWKWSEVISDDQQLADQREISYEETSDDEAELTEQDEPYDQVMTGWDPVQPVAGVKRPHSPEGDITKSQRGRTIKRVDYHRLHHGKTAQVSSGPKTWDEAMTSPEASHWKRAAEEEFQSLKQKGAIQIIPHSQLPKGHKPMKCKWVFKKKFLANGDIEKYKARCTAKGFTQRQCIDYHETFALTPEQKRDELFSSSHTN
ncbi:hypothetical protein K3495_g13184 [Podosphaera aphanis]|nr:hypothetical protein K3495_g13184 [Podosphaera aphanis]